MKKINNEINYKAKIFGSALAGCSEISIFHPVDTIAKRLMVNKNNEINFMNKISRKGKPLLNSLYQGFGYASLYKISQRVYKFGGQSLLSDKIKQSFKNDITPEKKILVNATSGSIIGLGESMLLPLDILKIKMQINPQLLENRNIFDIIKTERMNLYKGWNWTIMRNIPGSFGLFGGYTFTHEYMFNGKNDLNWLETFGCSTVGSTCSLYISSPCDVIKTRIQAEDFNKKINGKQVVNSIIKNEGYKTFFKGMIPKLLSVGPKLMFGMTISKKLIKYFENQ